MTSLKKEALAVLGLVISPDVGLVISVALLVMIFVAAAMNRPKAIRSAVCEQWRSPSRLKGQSNCGRREPIDFGEGVRRGLVLADDRGVSRLDAPVRLTMR